MNVPLNVTVGAIVLLGVGAVVSITFSGQAGNLDDTTNSLEEQGCAYQVERAEGDESKLSPECRDENQVAQIESAAQEAFTELSSGG